MKNSGGPLDNQTWHTDNWPQRKLDKYQWLLYPHNYTSASGAVFILSAKFDSARTFHFWLLRMIVKLIYYERSIQLTLWSLLNCISFILELSQRKLFASPDLLSRLCSQGVWEGGGIEFVFHIRGVFVWVYSGIGIVGTSQIIVRSRATLIPEWL